jgi:hypothetical protein
MAKHTSKYWAHSRVARLLPVAGWRVTSVHETGQHLVVQLSQRTGRGIGRHETMTLTASTAAERRKLFGSLRSR